MKLFTRRRAPSDDTVNLVSRVEDLVTTFGQLSDQLAELASMAKEHETSINRIERRQYRDREREEPAPAAAAAPVITRQYRPGELVRDGGS